ncbi:DUF4868 domain-containing protein [Desulfocurvus sp. DL9XJH121]
MKTLQDLQNFPFDLATASLWIIKKRIQERQAKYTARWVEIAGEGDHEVNLEQRLVDVVRGMVEAQKDDQEYDFVCNPDEFCLLTIEADNTNMPLIIDKMSAPGNEHQVSSEAELLNAAGYVIKIQSGDEELYAFKKTASTWSAKKVKGPQWAFFNGQCMIGIVQASVFQLYSNFDFLCYGDTVFIADKRSFESVMNYKESMVERRDEAVNDLEDSGEFSSIETIRDFIGVDMRYLRSISSILDKGFYRQPVFMERLRRKNIERGWGIQIDEAGKIVPTEDKMSDLFKLLNDFRLFSELSENIYDVSSTQTVGQ